MKQLLVSIAFIAFVFWGRAQSDNRLVIGSVDSVHSKVLNETRKIWVYVPSKDGTDGKFGKQRYPVVYVLDAEHFFLQTVSMIQQLHPSWGEPVCPDMIIVGILNTDRNRDMTPTHVVYDQSFSTSGGGEKFISFVEKELIPFIDGKYPTEPYKILTGFSLSGLAVMQTFVHHTGLFNSYSAIDPSLWWDDNRLLNESLTALQHKKFGGSSLYLAFSSVYNIDMDARELPKDTTNTDYALNLSILKFRDSMESYKKYGLSFQRKYYKEDWHNTVGLIAGYDALRFIFKDYMFRLSDDDTASSAVALVDKAKQHYAKYGLKPPGREINDAGYSALWSKKYNAALALFKYNLDRYPGSSLANVAMGDYYEARDDKPNAIIYYKKALEVEDIADIRTKLQKLQGK